MQKPITAPKVEECMLEPSYWLEQISGVNDVILTKKEIEKFNKESFLQMERKGFKNFFYDLKKFPAEIKGTKLKNVLTKVIDTNKIYYNQKGDKISTSEIEKILLQVNLDKIPELIKVCFGILIKRVDLKAFPTDILFTSKVEEIDTDQLQLTVLSANTPVVVLHESLDREWSYVQSVYYRGWIKKSSIALVRNREQALKFIDKDNFLVVTGSRVETEPNPYLTKVGNVCYQMGDLLPLLASEEIPESIPQGIQHAQSAEGCYVIKIPLRNENGFLEIGLGLIARSNDLQEGFLPYTKGNIIRQAFKMLGERYGWGGKFLRRDCSRFIMDIYQSMGIILPRDAGKQEEGVAGETYVFQDPLTVREKLLEQLEPGDPLYLSGHVMLYLGKVVDKYYVIHAGAGYGVDEGGGKIKPVTVHGVFIMELHQYLQSGTGSYLEVLTKARKFK